MNPKERAIRELYAARARRDWHAVGSLLADEVGWHDGREIAVYRLRGDRISEVWFYNEPSAEAEFSTVFAFD